MFGEGAARQDTVEACRVCLIAQRRLNVRVKAEQFHRAQVFVGFDEYRSRKRIALLRVKIENNKRWFCFARGGKNRRCAFREPHV